MEVATKDETMQQPGGTAQKYTNTIMNMIHTIESTEIPKMSSKTAANVDLLKNITNTMTDRCATNAAVDRLVKKEKEKRLQVLGVLCTH